MKYVVNGISEDNRISSTATAKSIQEVGDIAYDLAKSQLIEKIQVEKVVDKEYGDFCISHCRFFYDYFKNSNNAEDYELVDFMLTEKHCADCKYGDM